MFRLLFELNRRMPNGTYGGVRGIINLYSIERSFVYNGSTGEGWRMKIKLLCRKEKEESYRQQLQNGRSALGHRQI